MSIFRFLSSTMPGRIAARSAGRIGESMRKNRLLEEQRIAEERERQTQFARDLAKMSLQQQYKMDQIDASYQEPDLYSHRDYAETLIKENPGAAIAWLEKFEANPPQESDLPPSEISRYKAVAQQAYEDWQYRHRDRSGSGKTEEDLILDEILVKKKGEWDAGIVWAEGTDDPKEQIKRYKDVRKGLVATTEDEALVPQVKSLARDYMEVINKRIDETQNRQKAYDTRDKKQQFFDAIANMEPTPQGWTKAKQLASSLQLAGNEDVEAWFETNEEEWTEPVATRGDRMLPAEMEAVKEERKRRNEQRRIELRQYRPEFQGPIKQIQSQYGNVPVNPAPALPTGRQVVEQYAPQYAPQDTVLTPVQQRVIAQQQGNIPPIGQSAVTGPAGAGRTGAPGDTLQATPSEVARLKTMAAARGEQLTDEEARQMIIDAKREAMQRSTVSDTLRYQATSP